MAVAACGSGSSSTSDDDGGTGLAESSAPGVDAAPGLDSSIPGFDGALSTDSSVPGLDATTIPGLDATTIPGFDAATIPGFDAATGTEDGGIDGSAADATEPDASGVDATSGAEAGGGEDASHDAAAIDAAAVDATAHDSGGGMDSGPEASAPDAAAHDAGMEASVNCSATAPTGGTKECSSNASGTVNGNTWTIWSSGSGGCMTPYGEGAAFNATWNNSGDFLAREGLQWNSTKTYTQLGTISATFSESKTGSAGGYSYVGIYGWSENPLHEYYIVEDWYGAGPPNPGGSVEGTITVDGGTYKVYKHTQTNQPAITGGNATFDQFFSVRQTARQCGTISISEHFSQWATLGMTLGNMEEAKLLIEAGGGTGSITFATGTVTAN
jgi:hypothetical protein